MVATYPFKASEFELKSENTVLQTLWFSGKQMIFEFSASPIFWTYFLLHLLFFATLTSAFYWRQPHFPQELLLFFGSQWTAWFERIYIHTVICNNFFFLFLIFWLCRMTYGITVSPPGIEPVSPALEAQILNRWTAREVPVTIFNRKHSQKSEHLISIRLASVTILN